MFKLMSAELYRLLHKKSLYIYFTALAAGYFIIAFIRSGGFDENSVLADAMTLFTLLPALAGGFLFAAVYIDDLSSKNLITLVGYGVNKLTIIFVKFILMALFGLVLFGLAPLYHFAVYAILGRPVTAEIAATVCAASLKYLLTALAFAALSGVVTYGLQRATFAIVTYLLLSFGVVGGLVSTVLNTFAPSLSGFLMSAISDRILLGMLGSGPLVLPVAEYVVYVLAGLVLSAVAFFRKEMEF